MSGDVTKTTRPNGAPSEKKPWLKATSYPDLQVTQMVECCASVPSRAELVELISSAFADEFSYQIEKAD